MKAPAIRIFQNGNNSIIYIRAFYKNIKTLPFKPHENIKHLHMKTSPYKNIKTLTYNHILNQDTQLSEEPYRPSIRLTL